MSTATLFLIQAPFSALATRLEQLKTLQQPEDAVVLMGDAVLALIKPDDFAEYPQLYVLETDAKQFATLSLPSFVHVLSYADWATLCLKHQRIITLQ